MENSTGTRDAPAQGELGISSSSGDGEELDDSGRKRRNNGEAELNEAILLAKHVEKINSLKMDTRKAEAYQGAETESPGPPTAGAVQALG